MPKTIDSPFETVYLVNHSHIDHTWWNSPEICSQRNEEIINEILSLASAEPEFKFSYETTAGLVRYLEKYPDRKEEIAVLLQQRRLDVGGMFVSANDDVCSEEAIVRNFYYGAGWLIKTFNYSPKVAKEFDTPGHPMQLPQLVLDAGMKALVITRGPQGGFSWTGPDGSELLTYCVPYNWSYWRRLGVDYEETAKNLPTELARAAQKFGGPELVIPDGDDMTLPNPALVEICRQWNANYSRPKLRLATFDEVADILAKRKFQPRSGDMPNLWIVIHTLQAETTRYLKTLQGILPSVEALCTIECILKGDFKRYPAAGIDALWQRALLAADHNWGGKDQARGGAEGDEHKRNLVLKSVREGKALTENAFFGIAKSVMTADPKFGMPVLVFNPGSWRRDDIVSLDLNCGVTGLQAIEVVDADGAPVPAGYEVSERHKDGSIHRLTGEFLGRNVPSFGYSTFYIKPLLEKKGDEPCPQDGRSIENEFYRVTFAEDGRCIESLYDKEFDRELACQAAASFGPVEFEFGTFELFGVGLKLSVPDQSYFENPENEGSGESVEPTGELFRAADSPAKIGFSSRGTLSRSLTAEGEFAGSIRRQKVVLYEGLKRVDLHVELDWSGKSNVALFLQMPNALMNGQKYMGVPFAVHRDGDELADFWVEENLPVKFKIRGMQDWLAFESEDVGLAIASRWPVVDLTAIPAFPLLWTNDNSGFFFGERYRQKGNHCFSFSLTSYKGSWSENNIHLWGKQWAKPLLSYSGDASPETGRHSYLSIDAPNIILSAFKKARDEDAVIVRLYETIGRKTSTELSTSFPFQEARGANITETASKKIPAAKKSIKLKFRPFEIKTIKLVL
ncbi:MAG: hypothetical protein C4520_09165 [Candidatus Abyssobacteria bacterium SURF_5]|uniref:Glycoside hydrolase family 38 N-terminal domain-containing protein n=1 Tax=Abyssobacteria bacterium (strain SURF_5) TaxID=2093360 RepID=A0A3A4NUR4_ABYX5|nr:MAG: hypothetical protein C4520_09165 [Candidatus Abyssubacteria bacterium SURF_5]